MKTVFENELVQIVHGDVFDVCADQIHVEAVDLAFCDPPFNIGQNYGDEVSDRINSQKNISNESFGRTRIRVI